MTLQESDALSLERLFKARPAWTGIMTARDAIGLDGLTLLHSGPPAASGHVIPTLNSAAVACVFENWAKNLEEADALIASGGVTLAPAQDMNVATPLAAVVSPSMHVLVMEDLSGRGKRAAAPLNGGGTGGATSASRGTRRTSAASAS